MTVSSEKTQILIVRVVVLEHQYLTVVNIIQVLLRITWIINDKSSSQAVAVLVLKMTVIPECPLKLRLHEVICTLM